MNTAKDRKQNIQNKTETPSKVMSAKLKDKQFPPVPTDLTSNIKGLKEQNSENHTKIYTM